MRWASRAEVHAAALQWTQRLARAEPMVTAVGYFGSYARGDAGVGSDLDLVVILAEALGPQRRLNGAWATEQLPVPTDLLVYSIDEWNQLPRQRPRIFHTLCQETVWLWGAPPTIQIKR